MPKAKIPVTGVAGFVGSNLAQRLLDEACSVSGIDNLAYGDQRFIIFIRRQYF